MDARRMSAFPNSSFDIVLDRGTLDHFLAADAEPASYFEEVYLLPALPYSDKLPGLN